MRDIKFRQFDKETKKFHYWGFIGFYPEVFANPLVGSQNGEEKESQQYTGLKDKNDVEIYEGDIVKTTCHYSDDNGEPVGDAQEKIIEVKWVEDDGMQYTGFSFFPSDDIKNLEVIGNIYENKDLLDT